MANPEISVILTSYNVERYIEAALASVLSQEGVSLEVIAVDDGSTDSTWQLLSACTDARVKTIRMPKNEGPSAARNAGFAAASAPYLAVLDGDDQFLPGRLKHCLALAKAQNADIVVDNLRVHREEDGREFPMFSAARLAAMPQLSLADFIRGNLLFSGSHTLGYMKPIFSATFLKQHNLSYEHDIRIGEDYQIMAASLACGAFCAVTPTEGYRYTVRKGSISHRLTLEDITRMQSGDDRLLARYSFAPAAAAAQKQREACFVRAAAFTRLISAMKAHNAPAALKAIASCPSAVLLLRMPIAARLRRLWKKPTP